MKKLFLPLLIGMFCWQNGLSQTYTYSGSGDWHDTNNWEENGVPCNCVPGAGDACIIPNGSLVSISNIVEVYGISIKGELIISANVKTDGGQFGISNGGSVTVNNEVDLTNGTTTASNLFIGNGKMTISGTGQLLVKSIGFSTTTDSKILNNGEIVIENGKGVNVNLNAKGTIENYNSGTITAQNIEYFSINTLNNAGQVSINGIDYILGFYPVNLNNQPTGQIDISNAADIAILIGSNNGNNSGVININSSKRGINLYLGGTLNNSGTIHISNLSGSSNSSIGIRVISGAEFINETGGSTIISDISGDAIYIYSSDSKLTNNGNIQINNNIALRGIFLGLGTIFENTGNIELADISSFGILAYNTIFNDGTISSLMPSNHVISGNPFINNSTFKGNGIISNAFTNNGTLSPGLSPGTFTFNSALDLTSATLDMEIEGTAGGGQPGGHDNLVALGSATIGGTLNLTLGGSYVPQNNDQFTLIEFANGYTGTFAVENLPNGHWSIDYQANAIVVKYTDVCFLNGVTLGSQSEITNFTASHPGCTTISGDVTISGSDINDLSGLNGVTAILSNLTINESDMLSSLSGLENLSTLGNHLQIYNNDLLQSLDGLEGLSSLGGDLDIRDNPALASLSALLGIGTIGRSLILFHNNALTHLDGLDNVASTVNRVYLNQNAVLADLSALGNLQHIGGGLRIDGHSALTSLAPLSGVASINGDLQLSDNTALTSLDGLQNLDQTGISNLWLVNNATLVTCEVASICSYLDNGGPNNISANATGCNSATEVENACAALLPVELVDFRAVAAKNQVTLTWSTHSEANNSGFAVERSADGLLFEEIGWQNGHGTTSETHAYRFIDPFTPHTGTYFYRLKQIDWDGSASFSPVLSVQLEGMAGPQSIHLYPNPNSGHSAWLRLPNSDGQPISVRVFDTSGQHLHSLNLLPAGNGPQVLPLELPELKPGVCFFEIKHGGKVEWEKVIMTK